MMTFQNIKISLDTVKKHIKIYLIRHDTQKNFTTAKTQKQCILCTNSSLLGFTENWCFLKRSMYTVTLSKTEIIYPKNVGAKLAMNFT